MGKCLITRRGGNSVTTNPDLPVLDNNYPQDINIWQDDESWDGNFTLEARILKDGTDTNYEITWKKCAAGGEWQTVEGNSSLTYTDTIETYDTTIYSYYCVITNSYGSVVSRVATAQAKNPDIELLYTGNGGQFLGEAPYKGYLFFDSGILTIYNYPRGCSNGIFNIQCIGGGGGGAITGLGGGGYSATTNNVHLELNKSYQIIVGSGGSAGSMYVAGGEGGTSSFGATNVQSGAGGKAGSRVDAVATVECTGYAGSGSNLTRYRYSYNQDTGVYTLSNRDASFGQGTHTINLIYPIQNVGALYDGSTVYVYLAPNGYAYWASIPQVKSISDGSVVSGDGGDAVYLFNNENYPQVSGPGVFNSAGTAAAQRYGQGGDNINLAGKDGVVAILAVN